MPSMQPWLPSISLLSLSLTLSACLAPGQPWGVLDAELVGTFDPEASRLDDQGRLKTNLSFAVDIEDISLDATSMTLALASEADLSSFDPAEPPEGYSLCHNGHCHRDDGALVSYEDIAAELAGATAAAAPGLSLLVTSTPESLSTLPTPFELEDCGGCFLPRGELDTLSVDIAHLSLRGRVFDASTQGRLPDEGVAITLDLDFEDLTVLTFLEGAVERGYDPGLALRVTLDPGASILDDIDFSSSPSSDEDEVLDLGVNPAWVETITAQLGQLETDLTYFSLN